MNFHRLAFTLFILVSFFGLKSTIKAQQNNYLPPYLTLSFNGTFQTVCNDEFRNVSENGLYKAKYEIIAVSDEMRKLKNLQVFKDDRILFVMKDIPGSDIYISNSGKLAIMDMNFHFQQEITIHFYDKTGKFLMNETYRYASLFGFSPSGEKFVIGTDKNLHLIDLVNRNINLFETSSQFAFSEDEHYLATAWEDKLNVYKDYNKIATIYTGYNYPRGIAISTSGQTVYAIDKTTLKAFSIKNQNLSFKKTLPENYSFREIRIYREDLIFAGVHYRHDGLSKGILQIYDSTGNLRTQDEISSKNFPVYKDTPYPKKSSSKYETIPWPFVPFDQVHKVWNHYEQHMGNGSGDWSYLHQGLDIETPINEPTYAVQEGWVKLVLTLGGDIYWRVAVCPEQVPGYSDGWLYAHLVPGSIQVEVGDYVNIHDYLGDIIYWSDDWGHIHFVEIHDHGTVWYYDDDEWGINFNPLLALDPITDDVAPVIENFSFNSKFGFCTNETSIYLNPDDLHGDVDIIAKISDYHGSSEWEQPAFKTYYWFNKLPENTIVFPKTLGQILNHTYTHYSGSYYEPYAPLIYKKDNAHPSPPWMNEDRDYWQILTNNNGDSIAEVAELQLAFPTASYPDSQYRLFVEAWDEAGNISLDSMDVTFNNFPTDIPQTFADNGFPSKCFPNPAGRSTELEFYLPADTHGKVFLVLFTADMHRLNMFDIPGTVIGKNSLTLDLAGLEPGCYFYRISLENMTSTGKFIILK